MRKTSHLKVRLDDRLEKRFASVCSEQGVTMSEVLRRLVADYCDTPPVSKDVMNERTTMRTEPRLPKDVLKGANPKFGIGELYCGPGGLAVGASRSTLRINNKKVGFEHVWASDYDADTCQTYSLNLKRHSPNVRVICSDVHELDIERLPAVEGLMYGFPCNDFSLVGETKGLNGRFGPLYRYGIDYLNAHNPLFVLAENVGGLSSANEGSAFDKIVKELAAAGKHGYVLTKHLYKFEDYGVPQARHRIIIIGIRADLGLRYEVPKPGRKRRTSRDAIENPRIPKNALNHELTAQSKTVVERLAHIKPGENAWTADLPDHLRLNVKSAQLSQIYKRLDPDKPAYTVTGSGGGGTHVYHWSENRALTNRERARLQTFPDWFEFVGSKESVRKQIGMAVPADGAKVILDALLKTFFHVEYPHVQPSMGYSS
jgi:DNA (cytosine-5)-methyltransferase 1